METLAALYILHEIRGIAPDAIGGRHVDRSIELPSRPRVILWRITGAVEEHVVDAGAEHQIDVGFELRERRAEMLRQPGEGLTRGVGLSADMRS